MAAGPGAETEHGAIQAMYMPHPVVTQLGQPLKLEPVDWMKSLGLAAQEAGKAIQSSPLNPLVRQQMQAESMRAQQEKTVLQWYRDNPDVAYKFTAIGPNGASIMAPVQAGMAGYADPTLQRVLGPKTTTEVNKPAPAAPEGNQQQSNNKSKEAQSIVDTAKGYTSTAISSSTAAQQPSQPKSPAQPPANQNNQPPAQNEQNPEGIPPLKNPPQGVVSNAPSAPLSYDDLDARIRQAVAEALNPQQQYVQGYQQGGEVQPAPNTQGPVWSPFGNQVPFPASAPAPPVPQQPNPAASQQQLQAWQASNQSGLHPVIPSAVVKDYLQNNWDTRVKDVTYNPQGGPGGQPTYTAHTKDGGATTIPLAQLAKNAPHLVTGNNISFAMGAADQSQDAASAPGPSVLQPSNPPNAPGQISDDQLRSMVAQQIQNPANLMAGTGKMALAPDHGTNTSSIEVTNPSNFPDSLRSKTTVNDGPMPPGEQQGVRNSIVDQHTANNLKQGLDNLPNGPDGTKLATEETGQYGQPSIKWFVDNDPNLSHLPFMVVGQTPYSQLRMYNGNWSTQEVPLPDWALKKNIVDQLHQDPSGMTHQQMVDALQADYFTHTSLPVQQSTQEKLEGIRNQVLQSQRGLLALNDLKNDPDQWSIIRQANQWIQDHSNTLGGLPIGDQWVKAFANFTNHVSTGPKANTALRQLMDSWHIMHDEGKLGALSADERSGLDALHMDNRLPQELAQYQHEQAARLTRYVSQAIHNRERIDPIWKDYASSIRHTGMIPDTGLSLDALQGAARTPNATAKPAAQTQTQTAQPNAVVIPQGMGGTKENAYKLDGMSPQQAARIRDNAPHGTWLSIGGVTRQVP